MTAPQVCRRKQWPGRGRRILNLPADYRDQDLNKGSLKMVLKLYPKLIWPGVKPGIKIKIPNQPYAEKSSPVLKW